MNARRLKALERANLVGASWMHVAQPTDELSLDETALVRAANSGLNHVDSVGEASLNETPSAGEPLAAIGNSSGEAAVQGTAACANPDIHEQLS